MNLTTINRSKKITTSCNITIVCISFKLTNIFVTISKFIKFFGFFLLDKLLYTFSCGQLAVKGTNKKLSSDSYNRLINQVTYFLYSNNIQKIHFIVKSTKKINYLFIKKLMDKLHLVGNIKIMSFHVNISTPFNGCRLQKRKF